MNEVTKIHLGRQAFTISADAHHELKNYLAAIGKQVDDKDVLGEIELRMSELLTEHGINSKKVILLSDVEFLKLQLGNPNDFKEDGEEVLVGAPQRSGAKRLFRDTNNALLAGVAAGLAEYFGLDVLLVRILFILGTLITVGWGILLYIVIWLLVPEAKTPSERLQMAGKAVNVESLKEIVERADVRGVAHRANTTLAGPINAIFRFILRIIGIIFLLIGLSIIFGLIAALTYFLVNQHIWQRYNIFPIGIREYSLAYLAMFIVGLVALFIILFGIAIFRRKWPIRTWITGILIGLILISFATAGGLAAVVVPNVQNRYNANVHTISRTLPPFSSLNVSNSQANINFQPASQYSVSLSYYGNPDLASIKTSVLNKTLIIDSSQFNWQRDCQTLCFPNTYNLNITIYSPDADSLSNQFFNDPSMPEMPNTPTPPTTQVYENSGN